MKPLLAEEMLKASGSLLTSGAHARLNRFERK
jgi:hypothetical protein